MGLSLIPLTTNRMIFSYLFISLIFTIYGTSGAPSGCKVDHVHGDYDYSNDDYSNDYTGDDYTNNEVDDYNSNDYNMMGLMGKVAGVIPKVVEVVPHVAPLIPNIVDIGKDIFKMFG